MGNFGTRKKDKRLKETKAKTNSRESYLFESLFSFV